MGIACLPRATSCPVSTLPLPEHWLTSRADSTQYSAKQMRVKKRNPINTGLFPCTACMCDSSACCEGEASYSRGERSSDKAERGYAWPWTHFTYWLRERAAATTCKRTRLIKAGRQADRQIEEHVQGQLDGHMLVHPRGHLSTHSDHWLPYRMEEEEVMHPTRFWKRAGEIKTGINKACMTVLIVLPCTSLSVIYYSAQRRGDVFFA